MENFTEALKFLIGIIFTILVGNSLISWIERKITPGIILISVILGLVTISLAYLFLTYFKIPFFLINIILALFTFVSIYMFKPKLVLQFRDVILTLSFILIGTVLLNSKLIFEGFDKYGGFLLSKGNIDALWHIALQESLKISVPPQSPLYSGQILTGYHYLNDIYWVWFSKILGISTINLCIFWAPLFISSLFVATTLLVMIKIFKDKKNAFIASGVVVFTSSLSFIAPLFFPNAGFHQSVFWLDQPTYYIFNQQLTLSIAVINLIIFLFLSSLKKWWWVIGLLVGSLAGVKVYGLLIIFPAISIIGFYLWQKQRDWNYFGMILLSVLISIFIVLIEGPSNGFPFYFDPGLLVKSMFDDPLRLNYPAWEINRLALVEQHNWIKLFYQWSKGVVIFLIGNFNLKILALIFLPALLKNKSLSKDNKIILLLSSVVILLSLSSGLLLSQKAVTWNVVQFLVYAQLPLVVILVFSVITFFSKRNQIIIFLVIFLVGVPSSFHPIKYYSNINSYIYYPPELIQVLQEVKALPSDAQIIVGERYYINSFVPAFSAHGVYLADINVLELLLPFSAKERIEYVKKLENREIECKLNQYLLSDKNYKSNNLSNNNFQFIVIYKRNNITLFKCVKKLVY
ncbi:MAG: hypothetical protein PHQ59_02850 [Candidatus Daviesbacteria bacterium]|nr:hypothetical protein [Candidatus Daviesbacteria bacterium]